MKVMIFQPDPGGHHMILYLRHIAREVVRRGWALHLVTTRAALRHPAYPVVMAECGGQLQTSLIPDAEYPAERPTAMKLLAFQVRQLRHFARAYAELSPGDNPDVVYLENLDHCDKALALLGSPFGDTPFLGLQMAVRFHHRRMGVVSPSTRQDRLYEWLFQRLLRIPTMHALLTIDEPLVEYAHRNWSRGEKVRFVPDAAAMEGTLTREEARHSLDIHPGQVVVLAYGALSARKGVAELLNALADPSCPRNVVALLAGVQDTSIQALLASDSVRRLRAEGRLIEAPGFQDDAREYAAFRASDIVWLGYRGFYGMSGVLVQAGAMALPVIACSEGLIGWLARKHELGVVVDSGDVRQAVQAISRLATDPAFRARYGTSGRRMAERHTPSHFARAVCDALVDAVPARGAGEDIPAVLRG
jgi:glycosyltransferase involved in cell wall biosynthesis